MSRASGLKAVAVVLVRLINSPATRSVNPGAVAEVDFEHMDNQPPPIPPSPQPFASLRSEISRPQRGFPKWLPPLMGALVVLWFLKFSPLAVFLGAWIIAAYFGLRAKQSKLLCVGGGFLAACVALVVLKPVIPSATHDEAPQLETSSAATEARAEKQRTPGVGSLAWENIDAETRKSLAEMKLRDAEELAKELDGLLQSVNRGNLSVELVGKTKTWRHGVDVVVREVEEAGWKLGRDDAGTAMGQVYSALQSMTFAWDRFQKFIGATSASERESHAIAHANHLKLMRDNLRYAHEWLAKGSY